jgi:hypothetical protein
MSTDRAAADEDGRGTGFLTAPEPSFDAQLLYDDDLAELGFVTN